MTRLRTRARPRALTERRPSPMLEVALTAPVFAVYQLGLLVLDVQNGADWVTHLLMRLLDASVVAYVAFVLAIAAGLYAIAKRETRDPEGTILRILGESALLAVGLLVVVGSATSFLTNSLRIPSDSFVGAIIVSAGAGFHEELLFRVVLFEGGTRAMVALGNSRERATIVAAIASSILFALAHHLGPLGEPFALSPLVFRTLSGLYFAAILRFRGFATVVYTHALYDVLVLVVLR